MSKARVKYWVLAGVAPLIIVITTLQSGITVGLLFLIIASLMYPFEALISKYLDGRMKVYSLIIFNTTILAILLTLINTYLSLEEMLALYASKIIIHLVHGEDEVKVRYIDRLEHLGLVLLLCIVIGFLREFLGTGAISLFQFKFEVFNSDYAFSFLNQPMGGFVLGGILYGIINTIRFSRKDKEDAQNVI